MKTVRYYYSNPTVHYIVKPLQGKLSFNLKVLLSRVVSLKVNFSYMCL